MLHILWLILKVILILAGIILGLVLLAVLLLLFCPVCYWAEAYKTQDSLGAKGKITWLFRAISVSFAYEDNQRTMGIRILGIPLERITRFLQRARAGKPSRRRAVPRKTVPEQTKAELPQRSSVEEPVKEPHDSSKEDDGSHAGQEQSAREQVCQVPYEEPCEEPCEELKISREEIPPGVKKEFFLKTLWKKLKSFFAALRAVMRKFLLLFNPEEGPLGRMRKLFQKISYTIHRFYDKINEWKIFLGDAHTKAALSLVFGQARLLLGHVSPRKLHGRVVFGFEDPSKTGLVLAVLGMTMPLHKNRIAVEPVYDRVVLEGEVQLQGRIYGFVFLRAAWKIWFDKNVKDVRKRWKQKEVASQYGK